MVKNKIYAIIFSNYSKGAADESMSSIEDSSSAKGEEDLVISDIEGSGQV